MFLRKLFVACRIAAAAFALAACATIQAPAPAEHRAPVVVLVSIDAFGHDLLARGATPRIAALAAGGVSAAMRPSFPTKTFPNHWTLVTGLRPDRHGIVANVMEDPEGKRKPFGKGTDDPWWWNAATPVWVEAERAGIRTGSIFWPGSIVAVGGTLTSARPNPIAGGTRPSDWAQYSGRITSEQRVRMAIDWLRRPAATRPRFISIYLDVVDETGHAFGPDSPETDAALAEADRAVGTLVDGLAELGQPANLIVLSDHGLAATSRERVIAFDTIADPADYRLLETGTYASLFAVPGHEAALEARLLGTHPHLDCWRKAEIPARFRFGRNARVPPYFCLADPGWSVERDAAAVPDRGDHGYDNMAPAMTAMFVANGPSFRRGVTLAPFDNVDVAPLLRDLLGLPAATDSDGSDAPFAHALDR